MTFQGHVVGIERRDDPSHRFLCPIKRLALGQSQQCKGLQRYGARCRNKTLNAPCYCYHHLEQIGATEAYNFVMKGSQKVDGQLAGAT